MPRPTAALVDYLRDHRLLAFIGESGSGKSAVVRAGVAPALQGKIGQSTTGATITDMTMAARAAFDAAVQADESLRERPSVSTFMTDAPRIGTIQLVHEGNRVGAHLKSAIDVMECQAPVNSP